MKKITVLLATLFSAMPAMAQDAMTAAVTTGGGIGDKAYFALGASAVVGMAALGGTLAQGKIGAGAMDGIARNPQASKDMFVPMILGLALVESLVILSWLMGGFIIGKF